MSIIWKTIKNFPNYEVSSCGDVRRIGNSRNLSFSCKKCTFTSYARVTLFSEGKRHYLQVHRLVAENFLENPENLPQVDHKNADGLCNTVENLQWITGSDNVLKSFEQNSTAKLAIASSGGKIGGAMQREKAALKWQKLLEERFIAFYPSGTIHKDACVEYLCACGVTRIASLMWKELRRHKGTCPVCTDTVRTSSESLSYVSYTR